jgi:hypothetical protein
LYRPDRTSSNLSVFSASAWFQRPRPSHGPWPPRCGGAMKPGGGMKPERSYPHRATSRLYESLDPLLTTVIATATAKTRLENVDHAIEKFDELAKTMHIHNGRFSPRGVSSTESQTPWLKSQSGSPCLCTAAPFRAVRRPLPLQTSNLIRMIRRSGTGRRASALKPSARQACRCAEHELSIHSISSPLRFDGARASFGPGRKNCEWKESAVF